MTRIYLFADFGKGPRVADRNGQIHGAGATVVLEGEPRYRMLKDARRWWLVECESADAGRRIIHAAHVIGGGRAIGFACNGMDLKDGKVALTGRILDSGGAK